MKLAATVFSLGGLVKMVLLLFVVMLSLIVCGMFLNITFHILIRDWNSII